eukprot:6208978-Pleurochrysis_carterae.AAC.9
MDEDRGEDYKEGKRNNEKPYGTKHWGRVRTIPPRLYKQAHILVREGHYLTLPYFPEAYILARGAYTIPYHTVLAFFVIPAFFVVYRPFQQKL